jgi:lactate dehydrogenase-like 2-hydroxyacid dehydrogenase
MLSPSYSFSARPPPRPRQGARIMNVARGGVIDDDALARALDAGTVASCALDVFEEEPPKVEGHPLIGRCGNAGASQGAGLRNTGTGAL